MGEPAALRMRMVERLKDASVLVDPAVEAALRQVPRHLFLPHVDAKVAYLDEAVMVKYGPDGAPISSASQPTMVATMLGHLRVAPGHRVLEIGTGTGYNAALLSVLAGADGGVVSVELDPDLARAAVAVLDWVAAHHVQVVTRDGRSGYAPGAPYDRVVVTTGAREVAGAWVGQLVAGGRLVAPLVDGRGLGSVVVFDKIGDELVRVAETPCGFLPIRHAPGA